MMRCLLPLFLLELALSSPAHAQSPLTLVDVVRTSLSRHPDVRIEQGEVARSRGLAVQEAAPFDTITRAGLSQTRSEIPVIQRAGLGAERPATADSTALGLSGVTGTR